MPLVARVVMPSEPSIVVSGVEGGCRRVLIAKLRERGVDQDKAEKLVMERLVEAIVFWQARQAHHQAQRTREQKAEADYAFNCAFVDLATWVEEIALD